MPRLASTDDDDDDDPGVPEEPARPALLLCLEGEPFAVPMPHVAEVSRPSPLTRLPGAPGWLAGIANHRGRVLPVADLAVPLGLPASAAPPPGRRARVVLLRRDGILLGLRVERVDGLVGLPAVLEPCLSTLPAPTRALLAGQVTRRDGPLPVLDVDAVLALRETLPRSARAA